MGLTTPMLLAGSAEHVQIQTVKLLDDHDDPCSVITEDHHGDLLLGLYFL